MREDLRVRVGVNTTGFRSGLKRANQSVDRFSRTLKRSMVGAGLAIGGFLATVAIIGAKFDKEMRFVRGITQATEKEFKALTAVAKEMGRTTEFTSQEAAEGLRFLGMAGLDATDSIEALPQMLDLATAGMISLGRAADIATNILAQFSLDVSELTRVADVLAQVQSTANTNVEEAAQAFIYGGTMAAQFGMQIEDVAGILGLLANKGIKASMAGTTLSQAMRRMLNSSKPVAEIMKKYDIVITKADGSLRNFTDVILDMVDAQMGAQDVAKMLGARAGQLAALFNLTTEEIVKYINKMYQAEGRVKSLAEEIRKSFWGKWKEMVSKSRAVTLALFDILADYGIGAFETIGKGLDKLTTHFEKNADAYKDAFKTAFEFIVIAAAKTIQLIQRLMGDAVEVYIWWKTGERNLLESNLQSAPRELAKTQADPADKKYGRYSADQTFAMLEYKKIIADNAKKIEDINKSLETAVNWQLNLAGSGKQIVKRAEEWLANVDDAVKAQKLLGDPAWAYQVAPDLFKRDKKDKGKVPPGGDDKEKAQQKELDRWISFTQQLEQAEKASWDRRTAGYLAFLDKRKQLEEQGIYAGDVALENLEKEVEAGLQKTLAGITKYNEDQKLLKETFDEQYSTLTMSQFDKEKMAIQSHAQELLSSGQATAKQKIAIAQWTAKEIRKIDQKEFQSKVDMIQQAFSMMSQGFLNVAQMGGKYSKQAFGVYKSIKIAETIIATYSSAQKAYSAMADIPYVGPALGVAAAAAAVASGMAQVQAIRAAEPPSYGYGGVSTKPEYALVGERGPEVHLPVRKMASGEWGIGTEGSTKTTAPSVTVNMINQSGQDLSAEQQGQPRFDGRQMVLDVVVDSINRNTDVGQAMWGMRS